MKYLKEHRNNKAVALISAMAFATAFMLTATVAMAGELESKIAHGGLLYDKWYKITEGDLPRGTHASYPKSSKKKKKATWRCKECHGWDYKGKDGAYAKGSHFTGITGIRGSAGADTAKIVALLKSKSHNFTDDMFTADEFRDIALFVSKGQIDMDTYIDPKTKAVKGDAARGAGLYGTICANCHGVDGKLPKDLPDPLGKVAMKNPWETLHKIMNGQPAEKMPALRALPVTVSVDILAYLQTMPKE